MESNDSSTSLRVASFSCYLSNPEESFVKKLGVTYEDPYPAGFSPPTIKPSDNLANLRVESFSSYLKTGEDNFAFKTSGAPVRDPTIAFVFPPQASAATPKQQEKTKFKDGELSIFGADKYFNMKMDYGAVSTTAVKYREQMNKAMVNLPHVKPSSGTGTPSICSEVSSFNSQSALIQSVQTKQNKKMTGRRFFASFGCQPCSDVDKHVLPKPVSKHEAVHFSLSSAPSSTVAKSAHYSAKDLSIEEQRKSIEVFGSHKMRRGDIATNLERKLSMLTWDAIPKAQNLQSTTTGASSTVCDDMASDASSDLFEIENISSSGGYALLHPQTDDYIPVGCMSPTTQYAPSEASIEWSVMTASAADYSSVISDYDQKNITFSTETFSRNTANKNTKIKNGSGLLGCKSHKAVSVVETMHKTGEKVKNHQRG